MGQHAVAEAAPEDLHLAQPDLGKERVAGPHQCPLLLPVRIDERPQFLRGRLYPEHPPDLFKAGLVVRSEQLPRSLIKCAGIKEDLEVGRLHPTA